MAQDAAASEEDQRIPVVTLPTVLQRFVLTACNWPTEHVAAQVGDSWLADYVDDCPVDDPFARDAVSGDPPEAFIFRHGTMVPEIHRHFRGLEWKGRGKTDRTRVAPLGRLGNPSPPAELRGPASPGRPLAAGAELQLLQSAVRCALNPVLSEVCPNGPRCWDLQKYARKLVGLSTCPQDFDSLVERVQEHNRSRSFNEMVVLELLRQLRVLQVNAHKHYSAQSFESVETYGLWRKLEMERVNKFCEAIWTGPLPSSHFDDYSEAVEPRQLYSRLVELCFKCDEAFGVTLVGSNAFSQEASHLLDEFGLQFGVGSLYMEICRFQLLAQRWLVSMPFFQRCVSVAHKIKEHLQHEPLLINQGEMAQLRGILTRLHQQAKGCIMEMQQMFPKNSPRGALETLLALIQALLEVDVCVSRGQSHHTMTLPTILERYLNESLVQSYQRMFVDAAEEDQFEQRVTAKQLIATIQKVMAAVDTIKRHFKATFAPHVDIVSIAVCSYYDQLCTDFRSFCLASPDQESPDPESLQLVASLNHLDSKWRKLLPPSYPERWKSHFTQIILHWLEDLQHVLNGWVSLSLQEDKWTGLVFPRTRLLQKPQTVQMPLSSSVVDLFYGLAKLITFIRELMDFAIADPAWSEVQSDASSGEETHRSVRSQSSTCQERKLLCSQRLKSVVESVLHDFVCKLVLVDMDRLPATIAAQVETDFHHCLLTQYGLEDFEDLYEPLEDAEGSFSNVGVMPYPWGLPIQQPAHRSSRRGSMDPLPISAPRAFSRSARQSMLDLPNTPLSRSLGAAELRHLMTELPYSISRMVDSGIESTSPPTTKPSSRAASDSGHAPGMLKWSGSRSVSLSARQTPVVSRASSRASLSGVSDSSTGRARRTKRSAATLVTTDVSRVVLSTISADMCIRLNDMLTCIQLLPDLAATLIGKPGEDGVEAGSPEANLLSDSVFPGARVYLDQCWSAQLDMFVLKLNTFLKPTLLLLLRDLSLPKQLGIGQRLAPITKYLLKELRNVRTHLMAPAFGKVVTTLWSVTLQSMEEALLESSARLAEADLAPVQPHILSEAATFLSAFLVENFCDTAELQKKVWTLAVPFLRLTAFRMANSMSLMRLFHAFSRRALETLADSSGPLHPSVVVSSSSTNESSAPPSPRSNPRAEHDPTRARRHKWFPTLQPPEGADATTVAYYLARCCEQAERDPLDTLDAVQFQNYLSSGICLVADALHRALLTTNLIKRRGLLWKDDATFVGREVKRWLALFLRQAGQTQQMVQGGGPRKSVVVRRDEGERLGLVLHKNEVRQVVPQSPAFRAGIRPNDVLVSIGGTTVTNMEHDEVVALLEGAELRIQVEEAEALNLEEPAEAAEKCLRVLVRSEVIGLVTAKGVAEHDSVAAIDSDSLFRFRVDQGKTDSNDPELMDTRQSTALWDCSDDEVGDLLDQIVSVLSKRADVQARLFLHVCAPAADHLNEASNA